MKISSGLLAGPAICFVLLSALSQMGFDPRQAAALGAAGWMLVWWVGESVPIAVTSLLPIVLFPALGLMSISDATASYGSHYIFLFLGGFLIALALEKWNLHQRLALHVLRWTGHSRRRLIGGFMLATAVLSMWISNTATTLMMLPIAVSVLAQVPAASDARDRFAVSLLLGTAYAANIGGLTTLVGTPPNVAMASIYFEQTHQEVSFLGWMALALPFGAVLLFLVYLALTRWVLCVMPGSIGSSASWIRDELSKLGTISSAEKRVAWLFAATAFAWITRRPINSLFDIHVTDTGIAMGAGLLLFLVPSKSNSGQKLMVWKDTQRLPWDILLLFGGGLTLAKALGDAGWIALIGEALAGSGTWPWWAIAVTFTAVGLLLTEVMSNLALTVVFVPVVIQLADNLGVHPLLFAVPLTLASSCAFMLPMATPPNAIVFGSGKIRIRDMAGVGIWLNLVAIGLSIIMCLSVLKPWVERVG